MLHSIGMSAYNPYMTRTNASQNNAQSVLFGADKPDNMKVGKQGTTPKGGQQGSGSGTKTRGDVRPNPSEHDQMRQRGTRRS
ncbi:MAG: hypothetical protein VKJ04_09250 [Vampirovibrionales bacterium]|nr:hypothetical protein [Vampirovibrionales bacterium]